MAVYNRIAQDVAIEFLGKTDDEKLAVYNQSIESEDFSRALLVAKICFDSQRLVFEQSYHPVGGITMNENHGNEQMRFWKGKIDFCESEMDKAKKTAEKIALEQAEIAQKMADVLPFPPGGRDGRKFS